MSEPTSIGEWLRISCLGSGGFGVVHLWKNKSTNKFIAVKKCSRLSPDNLTSKQKERWCSEVAMMKSLSNENVVSFVPLPEELEIALNKYNPTRLPLLPMEYCSEGNLRHLLTRPESSCGLMESDVRILLLDLINALSYLHKRKITHRDLKPENVVLQKNSGRPGGVTYKVIDLGYAKEITSTDPSLVGTMRYLAPEIFLGEKYDHTVDYWSFGLLVFEAVCGVHPFLPFHPPPERFLHLKRKGPRDIFFTMTDKNVVKYRSELLEENHLSSCLRVDLEKWLRCVLHFDPSERRSPDGTDVFDSLRRILVKKIATVFVVNTYELVHYEIEDSTLLSTLQRWVELDGHVSVAQQMIIHNYPQIEDVKVVDILNKENLNEPIIIFKKGETMNKPALKLPSLVKMLFNGENDNYKWDTLKKICYHSMYFLSKEEDYLLAIRKAIFLLISHCEYLALKAQEEYNRLKSWTDRILTEIATYQKINKGIKLDGVSFYDKLMRNYESEREITAVIDRLFQKGNSLFKCFEEIRETTKDLQLASKDLERQMDGMNLRKLYDNVLLFVKSQRKDGKDEYSCKDVLSIMDEALKRRKRLVGDLQSEKINRKPWDHRKSCKKVIRKSPVLIQELTEVSGRLDRVQIERINLLTTRNKVVSEANSLSLVNGFADLNFCEVSEENKKLQVRLEEEISKVVANSKSVLEEFNVAIEHKETAI